MLSKLTIKNVALIEYAEIEFGEGLNVLSGETGAGKSVILDSINFVLGMKADRTMIRHGQTECLVKAEFLLPEDSAAIVALRDLDIETDGEIIISRKFNEAGKGGIKINGNTVTVTMLRSVTDFLVDVHGQSEHFFLLQENNQLKTLDSVIGGDLAPLKEELQGLLKDQKQIDQQISLLGGDEKERSRRLELLRFQIEEIEAVDLQENEEAELLNKRNKIMHLEKIITAVRESLSALNIEGGASDSVRAAGRALLGITRLDEVYESIYNKIETLAADIDETVANLSELGEELYFDDAEAAEIESRLDVIRGLQRKYGNGKEEIDAYFEKISAEYQLLSDCDSQYTFLSAQKEKNSEKIFTICCKMSQIRKTQGMRFCDNVMNELRTLNMPKAQFSIEFKEYSKEDVGRAGINGLDSICFMFSANAGEPMKPLSKIISGGEMSRFMLAIKTCLSSVNGISTYIFDEIDAGISGQTAKVVGEKLAKIAKNTQIIAVSHLAQVAVMSDVEFLIKKQELETKTITEVFALNEKDKLREIIRLLGGEDGAQYAEKHALEMLEHARIYKENLN